MVTRSTFLEKIFGFVLLSGYIVYILPSWRPGSFFPTFIVVVSIGIIAYAMGKIFSGEGGKKWLVPIIFVVLANFYFFAFVPQ